jgi:NAD-dependent SIR2 family protein deacetylase
MTKPTTEQIEKLVTNKDRAIWEASQAIKNADILLVSVGAGFSADSNLAVYNDVANIPAFKNKRITYPDLCSPEMLKNHPDLFYGFMGKCFNDYRANSPHEGYQIILQWKQSQFSQNPSKPQNYFPNIFHTRYNMNPFFVYSSNVDGHFFTAGYQPSEVYEIHGSMEYWQCENQKCCKKTNHPVWKAPRNYEFIIDQSTMTAPDCLNPWTPDFDEQDTNTMCFVNNRPRCLTCGGASRPNLAMFNDPSWIAPPKTNWVEWENALCELCEEGEIRFVNLEIGCGTNVPSVRSNSESLLRRNPKSTLIRINPEMPLSRPEIQDRTISILGKGLETLYSIQNLMNLSEPPIFTSDPPVYFSNKPARWMKPGNKKRK